MFKSLILCVVLFFSFNSLALTNEEKARKLYVEVNLDLEKNCSNYFSIIDITKSLKFFSKVKNSYNLSDISDLIEYEEGINKIAGMYILISKDGLVEKTPSFHSSSPCSFKKSSDQAPVKTLLIIFVPVFA